MNKVEIFNLALVKIGEPRVTSVDDNTKAARALKTIYSHQKSFCLKLHNWNFALNEVTMIPSGVVAHSEMNEFDVPSNYLKLVSVDADYTFYNGKIITDAENITLVYLDSGANEEDFSPEFIEVFSLKLALELVVEISEDEEKKNQLENSFYRALKSARYVDSSENKLNVQEFNGYEGSRL